MSAMEHGGHGHEKGHDSHESHAGKHNKWKEHAMTALKTLGIGIGAMAFGPSLLVGAGLLIPNYIIGGAAAMAYLNNKSDSHQPAKKNAHEGHH